MYRRHNCRDIIPRLIYMTHTTYVVYDKDAIYVGIRHICYAHTHIYPFYSNRYILYVIYKTHSHILIMNILRRNCRNNIIRHTIIIIDTSFRIVIYFKLIRLYLSLLFNRLPENAIEKAQNQTSSNFYLLIQE